MNMTKEQVQAGIAAGLALTGPESETSIPMKHASGAVILHQLLLAIGSGQVRLETGAPDAPAKVEKKPASPRKPRAIKKK